MAESKVEGGAYLSADRKTWHDANGNVIPEPAYASEKSGKNEDGDKVTPPAGADKVTPVTGKDKVTPPEG